MLEVCAGWTRKDSDSAGIYRLETCLAKRVNKKEAPIPHLKHIPFRLILISV